MKLLRHKAGRRTRLATQTVSHRLVEQRIFLHLMPLLIEHVHGPPEISYGADEIVVLSVVRNGELYVKSFIDHYTSLGVKHIVFLDNGSTDATVDLLRKYDVTVLKSRSRYRQQAMNLYLLRRFCRGNWGLLADIDEFFDYPYSDVLPLHDFINYLNHYAYTAVLTQVLDMFAPAPLDTLEVRVNADIGRTYPLYDISAIHKKEYSWPGLTNPEIKWHFGGVRSTVFGTESSLTKPALLRLGGSVKAFFSVHHVKGARIADTACLLCHYPFVGSFRAKVEEAAQSGRHAKAKWDYEGYSRVLARDPHPSLAFSSAQRFEGIGELMEQGFIVVSRQYRDWVQARTARVG